MDASPLPASLPALPFPLMPVLSGLLPRALLLLGAPPAGSRAPRPTKVLCRSGRSGCTSALQALSGSRAPALET